MNKSVQQLMDEKMCRPGYQWNETLQRCLGMGGGDGEVAPPEESIAPEPAARLLRESVQLVIEGKQ